MNTFIIECRNQGAKKLGSNLNKQIQKNSQNFLNPKHLFGGNKIEYYFVHNLQEIKVNTLV